MNDPRCTEHIPQTVAERLAEFCAAGKSGNLQLDIKEGRVINGKLTESIHVIDRGKRLST